MLIFLHIAHVLSQVGLIQCSDLLQQHSGIPKQAARRAAELYMGRLVFSFHSSRDGCRNHGWTVLIAYIILNDQDRPDAALLRANGWREVNIVDISAMDGPYSHNPRLLDM